MRRSILTNGLGCLMVFCLIATGCGEKKKKNKVNTNNVSTNLFNNGGPNSGPQYGGVPGIDGNQSSQIQQVLSSTRCRSGQRLSQAVTFSTTGFNHSGSRTTVAGQFRPGPIPGRVSQVYVGTSVWNDLMFVSKVVNGTSVAGYNVTISMCSMSTNNGIPLIDDRRQLANFQATRGIILGEDNHCGLGSVDSAQYTFMQASQYDFTDNYGHRISLGPWAVWTTFFKPACNGTY